MNPHALKNRSLLTLLTGLDCVKLDDHPQPDANCRRIFAWNLKDFSNHVIYGAVVGDPSASFSQIDANEGFNATGGPKHVLMTAESRAGAERIDLMHITLERCSLTNGVAPCCSISDLRKYVVNMHATRSDYAVETFDAKFCTPASIIPDGYTPFLQSADQDSAELDPENG